MEKKNKTMLDEIGKNNPFAVPENYFEDFATQFDQQIHAKSVPVRQIMKPWLYMAAMFIGIVILGNVFYNIHNNSVAKNSENYELYVTSQLDESVVYDYYVNDEATATQQTTTETTN